MAFLSSDPQRPEKLSRSTTIVTLLVIAAKLLILLSLKFKDHLLWNEVEKEKQYTYVGRDYPHTWDIDVGRPVIMRFEDTVRFAYDDNEASNSEWESLTPGKGLIYLGEEKKPFSISMFHQLRCISILREEAIRNVTNPAGFMSGLGLHCLNYLRQTALCRASLALEPVTASPPLIVDYDYTCRDWTAVYRALSENHRHKF